MSDGYTQNVEASLLVTIKVPERRENTEWQEFVLAQNGERTSQMKKKKEKTFGHAERIFEEYHHV